MTTTPDSECPDHGDPIECACEAARGWAEMRRKRYKAALARVLLDSAGRIIPEHIAETGQAVSDSADAVIAVADQEQRHWKTVAEQRARVVGGQVAEIASLRAELQGVYAGAAHLRAEAAEVRAAAYTEAADTAENLAIHFHERAESGEENGALEVASLLRAAAKADAHRAAAARPDDTTGA